MNWVQYIYFFFWLMTFGGAVFLVFAKDVISAAFSLLICFLGVAALFILAGAEFLGVAQIMIYIGGILLLFLFGIMMSRRLNDDALNKVSNNNIVAGLTLGLGLLAGLLMIIVSIGFSDLFWIKNHSLADNHPAPSHINSIGIKLMTDYILPFEIAALILMLALMGASVIAAKVIKRKS